jgi:hypothetical protein
MKAAWLTAAALSVIAGAAYAGTTAVDPAARNDGDRMTTALNLLEAQGDASFTNFAPAGSNYTATVTQNGQRFKVTIDPDAGTVTPQG